MSAPIAPAKEALRENRQRANWSRLLLRPIHLRDGKVLLTLKDAAERILELPPAPVCRVAAERIIASALHNGDMVATQAAVRLALFTTPGANKDAAAD